MLVKMWFNVSEKLPPKQQQDDRCSKKVILCVLCHNETWEEDDECQYLESSDFYYGYFDAVYDYKNDSWLIFNMMHNSISANGIFDGVKAEYNFIYYSKCLEKEWVKPYAWTEYLEPPSDIESALEQFSKEHDTWEEGYSISLNES
jgi:hypothetical protein